MQILSNQKKYRKNREQIAENKKEKKYKNYFNITIGDNNVNISGGTVNNYNFNSR